MEFLQSPNHVKGRNGHKVKAVVLHITEGSYTSSLGSRLGWLTSPASNVSSHYLIGDRVPYTIQLVKEEDTAWHCGLVRNPTWKGLVEGENPNQYTIGIEVALINSSIFPNVGQWFEVARLVKDICKRHNLPLDREHVIGHNEIRSDKLCPGKWITPNWILLLAKLV